MIIKKVTPHQKWFDIPGGDGARILIRSLRETEMAFLGQSIGEIEDDPFLMRLLTKAVVDWDGIEDEKGRDLAVTLENKKELLLSSTEVLGFINECVTTVMQEAREAKEEAEGNL